MTEPRQKDLFTDLPRDEQYKLIKRLQLPDFGRVKRFTLKSILYRVIDFANPRCYARQDTLAFEANCSVKTVERSLAALVALEVLIFVEGSSRSTNEYAIDWTKVKAMVRQSDAERQAASQAHEPDHGSVPTRPMVGSPTDHGSVPTRPMVGQVVMNRNSNCNLNHKRERPTTAPSVATIEVGAGVEDFSSIEERPINVEDTLTDSVGDEWKAIKSLLVKLGVSINPIPAAKRKGFSPDYVSFLIRNAGSDAGPGALHDLVSGKTQHLISHDEYTQRRRDDAERLAKEQVAEAERVEKLNTQLEHELTKQLKSQAEAIRQSHNIFGPKNGLTTREIDRAVFQGLKKRGLEAFCTDAERSVANLTEPVAPPPTRRTIGIIEGAKASRVNGKTNATVKRPPPIGKNANKQRQEIERTLAQILAEELAGTEEP